MGWRSLLVKSNLRVLGLRFWGDMLLLWCWPTSDGVSLACQEIQGCQRSEAKTRSITCIRLRYRTAQLFSLTFRNNLRVDFGNFSSGPELLPMLIKRVLVLAARSWNSKGFAVLASCIAYQIVASLHWMRVCNDLLFMHARIPVMVAVRVMWWSCVCDPKLEDRFCRNPAASNKF